MSEAISEGSASVPNPVAADAPVRYPTNVVLGVVESDDQLESAFSALTGGGFMAEEIQVSCGAARAEALRSSTGRSGLAAAAVRIAQAIGIQDSEMEFKSRYENAMRDGHYVVGVAAPSEIRKDRAVKILSDEGAHTVSFHGRFSIEGHVPPSSE